MNDRRYLHSSCVLNGKIYIFGPVMNQLIDPFGPEENQIEYFDMKAFVDEMNLNDDNYESTLAWQVITVSKDY